MKRSLTIFIAILTLCIYSGVFAATPDKSIGFQGQLYAYNAPVTNTVNATFTFYDALTDGTVTGSTISKTITVSNGYFGTTFSEAETTGVDFNQQLFLEVTINGTPLTPRTSVNPTVSSLKTFGAFSYTTPPTVGPVGSLYFNSTTNELYVSQGSTWQLAGLASSTTQWSPNGTTLNYMAGNVGIGTTTPESTLSIIGTLAVSPQTNSKLFTSATSPTLQFAAWSNSERSQYRLQRYRGTALAPLAVQLNDYIGTFGFQAYDGTALQQGGNIDVFVDGAVATGSVPTRISFTTGSNVSDRQERMVIKSNGDIGIGTTSPSAKFAITGISGSSTDLFAIASSSNARLFTVTSNGNVGIGTTTPVSKFVVIGTSTFSGNVGINISATSDALRVFGASTVASNGYTTHTIQAASNTAALQFYRSNGTIGSETQITAATTIGDIIPYGRDDIGGLQNVGQIRFASDGAITSTNSAGNIKFYTVATGTVSLSERMIITSAGNVGIGTTNPGAKLHISGYSSTTTALTFGSSAAVNNNRVIDVQNSAGAMRFGLEYDNAGINLNIVDRNRAVMASFKDINAGVSFGTTTQLSGAAGAAYMSVAGSIISNNDIGVVNPNNASTHASLGWLNDIARIRIGGSGTGSGNGFDIQGAGNISWLRILNNGNVGIGTTTPNAKFTIETTTADRIGMIIRTTDNSTTNNLQEWQLSTGTAAATISAAGAFGIRSIVNNSGNVISGTTFNTKGNALFDSGATGQVAVNIFGRSGQTADLLRIGSTGITGDILTVSAAGNVGIGATTSAYLLQVGPTLTNVTNFTSATLPYGNISNPQIVAVASSGEVSIGLTVNDGTNNRRAKLFLDNTNSTWGLMSTYATGGRQPFVISQANTEVFRIDALGNVGIGTTSPSHKIDAWGDHPTTLSGLRLVNTNTTSGASVAQRFGVFNGNNGLVIEQSTNAIGPAWASGTYDAFIRTRQIGSKLHLGGYTGASDLPIVTIDGSGNVGIGTTTPHTLLTLKSTTTHANLFLEGATGAFGGIITLNKTTSGSATDFLGRLSFANAGTERARIASVQSDGVSTSGDLQFYTTAGGGSITERMRILGNGNVGIGTITPTSFLHVFATGANVTDIATFAGRLANEGGAGLKIAPVIQAVTVTKTNMYGLNVSPTFSDNLAGLDVTNFASIKVGAMTGGNAGAITNTYGLYVENNTQGTNNYGAYFAGNIGIGTTTPTQALVASGTIQSTDLLGGITTLSVDASGNIIRTPSDSKLKTNVETIASALEKVNAMRGVTYNWIDTSRFGPDKEIGFIAQELETIVPEVVKSGGEYKSVNYQNLVALLVEAIKELSTKFDTLSETVKTKFVDAEEVKGQKIRAEKEFCIGDTCITEQEFKEVLQNRNTSSHTPPPAPTPVVEEIPPITEQPTEEVPPTPEPAPEVPVEAPVL